jgi:hypothetical protein
MTKMFSGFCYATQQATNSSSAIWQINTINSYTTVTEFNEAYFSLRNISFLT